MPTLIRHRLPWLCSLIAAAGCGHQLTQVGPSQSCEGQLVLEFTNRGPRAVKVGWLTLRQLRTTPGGGEPIWLGTVDLETVRFEVPEPGRVLFKTANPAGLTEDRHHVSHRLLCRR